MSIVVETAAFLAIGEAAVEAVAVRIVRDDEGAVLRERRAGGEAADDQRDPDTPEFAHRRPPAKALAHDLYRERSPVFGIRRKKPLRVL